MPDGLIHPDNRSLTSSIGDYSLYGAQAPQDAAITRAGTEGDGADAASSDLAPPPVESIDAGTTTAPVVSFGGTDAAILTDTPATALQPFASAPVQIVSPVGESPMTMAAAPADSGAGSAPFVAPIVALTQAFATTTPSDGLAPSAAQTYDAVPPTALQDAMPATVTGAAPAIAVVAADTVSSTPSMPVADLPTSLAAPVLDVPPIELADALAPVVDTAPLEAAVQETVALASGLTAPVLDLGEDVASGVSTAVAAMATLADTLAADVAPLTTALTDNDLLTGIGGTDPAAGISTLVEMVSAADTFDLSDAVTPLAQDSGSIVDLLAVDIADAPLLGDADHDGAAPDVDDAVHGILGGL